MNASASQDPLRKFPAAVRAHPLSADLAALVRSLTTHPLLDFIDESPGNHATRRDLMKASTLFTACFYGNLHAALTHHLLAMHRGSPLAVQPDTEMLHLLLDLSSGELATCNIPTLEGNYCPHYVPMLEAAKDAGVDTRPVELLVESLRDPNMKMERACERAGIHRYATEYLVFSNQCTQTFEDSFSTIALRELTLSDNFRVIESRLPAHPRYERWKAFLNAHIALDEREHGPLMARALERVGNADRVMRTMIGFYERRRDVYDGCLMGIGPW